ncbi:unnamed protein product [Linum tenue]|uniref:Uncharacterized protein n=1 Tax=Linum tenue TaxID=586396 RepID=A0AAV0MG15_9ROSI|nr:unnamed protein product [Linum tenue]
MMAINIIKTGGMIITAMGYSQQRLGTSLNVNGMLLLIMFIKRKTGLLIFSLPRATHYILAYAKSVNAIPA